ncbi:hypothetical protein [Saliphagus infecundisoli]|uniref:Apea-like HEPN domain-containing protein n=1 Tax=Saliphagus infecundisoli TaxID=1849069 RepID=A0ABD5QHW3_9EURY|nr:hypothetical protein [Saliphagus infecundisoli]
MTEEVKAALDCIRYWSYEGATHVDHGRQKEFRRHVLNIIDSETSYDGHEDRLTKQTLLIATHELLIEVKEETHENPNKDPISIFEGLKAQMLRETLGKDLTTYTIAFPLNIQRIRHFPSSFSVPETTIKNISRDTWKNEYESVAWDDESFERFLQRESPNSLEKDNFGNSKFTFWTADFDARDGYYALFQMQDIVRLFISKLNYALHKQQRARSQPANKTRPSNVRWSPLRQPFFYFIFDGAEYVDFHPMNFDYRRRAYFPPNNIDELVDDYLALPDLPATPHGEATPNEDEEDNRDRLDKILEDALLAYQDGITAATPQQSFFSFWRGIDSLTHVERDQPSKVALKRARVVFEKRSKGEYITREEREAIDELWSKRNDIAHIGSHVRIDEPYRTITKRMLDKLIQLHFDHYQEYNTGDFQTYLKHHDKQLESKKEQLKTNKRKTRVLIDMLCEELDEDDDPLFVKAGN